MASAEGQRDFRPLLGGEHGERLDAGVLGDIEQAQRVAEHRPGSDAVPAGARGVMTSRAAGLVGIGVRWGGLWP